MRIVSGTASLLAAIYAIPAMAGNPVVAVWKERHIDFVFLGRTARYTCDGLRYKVRAMLLDLGARRDAKVAAVGCQIHDRLRANSLEPSLSILFSAPALPDVDAKPPGARELAAPDARFVAFTISSDAFRNMGIGDCELVQEFVRQILPTLATRNVRQNISCEPQQPAGSHFFVRGEILKTLPQLQPTL